MTQNKDEIKFFNKAADVEELLHNEIIILCELLQYEHYNENVTTIKELTTLISKFSHLRKEYTDKLNATHLRRGRDDMVVGMKAGKQASCSDYVDDNTNWDLMNETGEAQWTQD